VQDRKTSSILSGPHHSGIVHAFPDYGRIETRPQLWPFKQITMTRNSIYRAVLQLSSRRGLPWSICTAIELYMLHYGTPSMAVGCRPNFMSHSCGLRLAKR
jgi:hypothetical protein